MYERSPILMERKFNEYLLPTVLISVALSMATVIDSVIVGNLLGETALSAVGLASPVIYGLNALFLLFAVGGVACASIAKGRREDQNANRIFTLTFGVGSAALLALTAALLAFIGPISLALAQGDAELARLTQAFLTPAVFIGPFMLLTMGLAQFVRADGRPRLAAWVAIAANAVKLVLTYVFIRFLDTGISGAALSTVLGYAAGFLLLLPYFFSKERGFKLVKIGKGDFGRLTGMLRVGLPEALTQGLSFLRALVLNLLIVSLLGALGMTVMTLCINALMIASIVIFGTNDTLLPIVGTLYGEKDWSGIRFTMRAALRFLMIAGVAIALIFLLIPGAVGRLLGITSAEGLALAVPALRLFALSLPVYGLNVLLQSYYQITGREKLALLTVTLNGFVFVVLFAFALSLVNANLIWLAFVLAEIAAFLVIWAVRTRIGRREGLRGALLLRGMAEEEASADLSMPATVEAAAALSAQIITFCKENGADSSGAMRIGLALEEMAVNTARYGHSGGKGVIDVLARVTEDELILRLRDDGKPFDPTKYHAQEEHDFAIGGIEVVRRLAKDISYSRQLGFNVTIITIARLRLSQ